MLLGLAVATGKTGKNALSVRLSAAGKVLQGRNCSRSRASECHCPDQLLAADCLQQAVAQAIAH